MPRKARVLVSGCPHHIVQRGHNRNAVFLADEDYQFYLENLLEWKTNLEVKLYGWCLMTNHIHLIVEPMDKPESLSLLMKRLSGRQAAYTNKLEGRCGSLWQGRFKASPIQKDAYLLACIRYVELNPVKAGMVKTVAEYPWSSYCERAGLKERKLLDFDASYRALGSTDKDRLTQYRHYLTECEDSSETKLIRDSLQRNQLTGDTRFVDEVDRRLGMRIERRGRGRPVSDKT
mgnify:CR=1 FL=1